MKDQGLSSSSVKPTGAAKSKLGGEWQSIDAAPRDGTHIALWMAWPASLRTGWADAFAVRDCWWQDGKWVHVYRGAPAELDANYITAWAPASAEPTSGPDGEALDWWRA